MAPSSAVLDLAKRELSKIEHLRQSATLPFEMPSRVIIGRAASSSAAAKKSDNSDSTLPIALGAAIPITCALIVLFFLHRRHVKKLRSEDASDRVKDLDFGMNEVAKSGKKGFASRGKPEMTVAEVQKEIRRDRGMSMDLDMTNPYLLPPGLQTSRESIHSLSRTLNSTHDPYRPATTYVPTDSMSNLRTSRRGPDDSSSYSGSGRRVFPDNESSQNLLRNAQRMSRSLPPTQRNSVGSGISTPIVPEDRNGQLPRRPPPPVVGLPAAPRREIISPPPTEPSHPGASNDVNPNRTVLGSDADYLGAHIRSGEGSETGSPPPEAQLPTLPSFDTLSPAAGRKSPPRITAGLPGNPRPVASKPSAEPKPLPDAPAQQLPRFSIQSAEHENLNTRHSPQEVNHQIENNDGSMDTKFEPDYHHDPRRMTMGFRPLPPEDPSEDPEMRANRIRSFYKEYFDDSKPGPAYTQNDYYESNDYDYGYDGAFYDPVSGQFIAAQTPYAEPIGRRAMTPPPRGPPRFHGQPSFSGSFSSVNFGPGPRAYSSASGRYGPPRAAPKKAAPPPKPLHLLPTPHMLKDDSFIPIDFAPPSKVADRITGKAPDSPRGGMVPFIPRPAHRALASSFDDLALMPSPHALRKSGTFTALDFAPPPRFKSSDTGSDAGSIRSNRSGRSAMQVANIRAGAYRLSRIPRDVAGTKDEITQALRPAMDMR